MAFLNFYNVPLKEGKSLARMMSCFYCFLQMVVVRQNLHQKVELQRLGLQERKASETGKGRAPDGKLCIKKGEKPRVCTCGLSIWTRLIHPEP